LGLSLDIWYRTIFCSVIAKASARIIDAEFFNDLENVASLAISIHVAEKYNKTEWL